METPLEIDFHGLDVSPAIKSVLEDHVQQLETRFSHITHCRVVITGPGDHHRSGGLYDVRVQLTLPNGKDVAVRRVNHGDERYADIHFAINDTFKRARRQLRDQVRRLQGRVKHHEAPPIAMVARIDDSGQFGFLQTGDGRELYFHRNSVIGGAFEGLSPGDRVTFAEVRGEEGPRASTVRIMGKHGLR